MAMMEFFSWHCKNLCNGNRNTNEKWSGINHIDTMPACSARSDGCPNSLRIGVAKRYIGRRRIAQRKSTIHDRCMYMPNIWYFFAPKACPHSVSRALAIPSCKRSISISYNNKNYCVIPLINKILIKHL